LEPIFGKKYKFLFQNSEFCNVSVVGLGVGKNIDILNIIKMSLKGVNIYKVICLQDSINITVLKKDEPEILAILHNMFIG
jgi:aspartokinase